MRHSDIRTTMNQYGDALTDDMRAGTLESGELGTRSGLTDRTRIAEGCNLLKEWLLR